MIRLKKFLYHHDTSPKILLIPGIVLALALARIFYFYFSPAQTAIAAVPDDAFYFIQLALHRLVEGFWTFDGVAPATGFHLLYGYSLYALFALFGDLDWRTLLLVVGIPASFALALSCMVLSATARRVMPQHWIVAGIPLLTPFALQQATALMESWLVLSCASLTVFLGFRDRAIDTKRAVLLILVGVLGSLARSDFGMLPGIMFCVVFALRRRLPRPWLGRCFFLLLGAVFGVATVLIHTYGVSGQLSQASAQVKFFWSQASGHHFRSVLFLVFGMIAPGVRNLPKIMQAGVVASLAALACYTLFAGIKNRGNWRLEALVPGMCGALTLLGYVLFYRFNSAALATWYSSNLLVPFGLILATVVYIVSPHGSRAIQALLVGVYALTGAASVAQASYPHQQGAMQAGLLIRHMPDARFAAWNAGIISYFSQRPVINIDGLVNDDALTYIRGGTLLSYLQQRNIRYIVDFDVMMAPKYRRRGGYLSASWDRCVVRLRTLDDEHAPFQRSHLALYEVKERCR